MTEKITLRIGDTDVELTDPDEIKEFIELQKKQLKELIEGVPDGGVSASDLIKRKVSEYFHRAQGTQPEVSSHRFDREIAYFTAKLGDLGISPSSNSKLAHLVQSLKEANKIGDVFEDDLKRIQAIAKVIEQLNNMPDSPEKGRKAEEFLNVVDFAQFHTVALYAGGDAYLEPLELSDGRQVIAEPYEYSTGKGDIDVSTNDIDDIQIIPFAKRLLETGKPFTMVTGEPGGYVFSVKISIRELEKDTYNKIMERLSKLPISMYEDDELPITKKEMEDILSQVGDVADGTVDFTAEKLRNTDIADLGLTDNEKKLDPDKKRKVLNISERLLAGYSSFNFYQMVNRADGEHEIPAKLAMKRMHFNMNDNRYLNAIDDISKWEGDAAFFLEEEKLVDLVKQYHGQIIDDLLEFHKDTSGKFEEVNASWVGTSNSEDQDWEFDEKIRKAPLIFAISQFVFRMSSIYFNRFDVSTGEKKKIEGEDEFASGLFDEVEQKIHALDNTELTPTAREALDKTLEEIEVMRSYH